MPAAKGAGRRRRRPSCRRQDTDENVNQAVPDLQRYNRSVVVAVLSRVTVRSNNLNFYQPLAVDIHKIGSGLEQKSLTGGKVGCHGTGRAYCRTGVQNRPKPCFS